MNVITILYMTTIQIIIIILFFFNYASLFVRYSVNNGEICRKRMVAPFSVTVFIDTQKKMNNIVYRFKTNLII